MDANAANDRDHDQEADTCLLHGLLFALELREISGSVPSLPSTWIAILCVQIPDVFSIAKSRCRAIFGVVGVCCGEAVEKVARCST